MNEEMEISIKLADIIDTVFMVFKPRSYLGMVMELRPTRNDYKCWIWRFDHRTFCELADMIANTSNSNINTS